MQTPIFFHVFPIPGHIFTLPNTTKIVLSPSMTKLPKPLCSQYTQKKETSIFFFSPSPSSLPPTRRTATTIRIFRHRIVQVPQPRFVWRDNTEKRYKKYRSENPGLRQPCRALFTLLQDMRWTIQTVFFMLSLSLYVTMGAGLYLLLRLYVHPSIHTTFAYIRNTHIHIIDTAKQNMHTPTHYTHAHIHKRRKIQIGTYKFLFFCLLYKDE